MNKATHRVNPRKVEQHRFSGSSFQVASTDPNRVTTHHEGRTDGSMADLAHSRRRSRVNEWYSQELSRMNEFQKVSEVDEQYDQTEQDQPDDSARQFERLPPPRTDHQGDHRRIRSNSNELPQIIAHSLDPFINVAGPITPRQRSLVQFYMKDLATILFGVSNTALYSPCAATGMAFVGDSRVATTWVCILAEEMMSALRGQQPSDSLVQQKARAYKGLKHAILNRRDNFQEAIMAVSIAGLFQYGFGDAYSQDLHATMADRLIRERSSIEEAIQCAPHLEPFYFAAQFAFGRTRIDSLQDFANVRQQWIANIKSVFEQSILEDAGQLHDLCGYRQIKQDFSSSVKFALAGTHKPSPFAKAMRLSMLNEISWTVLSFEKDRDLIVKFFRRMHFICQHSMLGANVNGGQTHELRAAAVASMVSRARRDTVDEVAPERLLKSDADVLRKHTIALKMFYYMSEDSQDMLLGYLVQWLELNDTACIKTISNDELAALELTVTELWAEYNRTRARR